MDYKSLSQLAIVCLTGQCVLGKRLDFDFYPGFPGVMGLVTSLYLANYIFFKLCPILPDASCAPGAQMVLRSSGVNTMQMGNVTLGELIVLTDCCLLTGQPRLQLLCVLCAVHGNSDGGEFWTRCRNEQEIAEEA